MRYLIVAEAYRDLEGVSSRLALTERLAALLAQTPAALLPTVCYLCQGLIAPEFAGIDLGLAEKLAVRAVTTAARTDGARVAAQVRETGDLGQAAELLLTQPGAGGDGQAASLEVSEVVRTLREIAAAEGTGSQGRKVDLLTGLLARATPLEARYLLRLVTRNLRLGVGTPGLPGGSRRYPISFPTSSSCCGPGWGRPRRSSRGRSSRTTRPRASCGRSARSCCGAGSTASTRPSGTCPWACSASSCCTPTART